MRNRSAGGLDLVTAALVVGVYEEPIEGWIGQIQSALSDEFKGCEGEHGFLIEATTVAPVCRPTLTASPQ